MAEVPKLTTEQRHAALEKALANRKKRAAFLKDVSSGKMNIAEALASADDPVIGATRVKDFIKAVPGYGKVKTEKLMKEARIAESRRLQGLGSLQCEALIARLKEATQKN